MTPVPDKAARAREKIMRTVSATNERPACAIAAAVGAFLLVMVLLLPAQGAAQDKVRILNDIGTSIERATRLMADKRYEEAADYLEFIHAAYPNIPAIIDMLCQCYLMTGRPQDAIVLLEAQLEKEPKRVDYIKKLGNAYLDLGERERAVAVWGRLLSDDERRAGNYGIVARIEQDAGMYEEALATLRAGRRFEKHFSRYTMEIVHLERKLGREKSAFRNGVIYLSSIQRPSLDQAGFALDLFRDVGSPPELVSVVDSVTAAVPRHERFLRRFKALLLVEAGRYGEAAAYLAPEVHEPPNHQELFEFLSALSRMHHEENDDGFNEFYLMSLDRFLVLHRDSPVAPTVLLLAASKKRMLARNKWPPDSTMLSEVLVLADSVTRHPRGRPHGANAMLLKATVLMDDLYMPVEALETIERTRWRSKETLLGFEELRMRALLAAGQWSRAEKRFRTFAEHRDSTYAVIASYGLGRLYFYTGRYDEAVAVNSELAEKYSWSKWANDALETAMVVKKAMGEANGSLALYSSALLLIERGEFGAALDSLAALEQRCPGSGVIPESLLLKARLLVRLGETDAAESVLVRISETYPLHEAAPRALELLGEILEEERPVEAVRRYSEIIERYPADPFLNRVRNRYIALQKTIPDDTEEETEQ